MRRLAIALLLLGLFGGCSLGDEDDRPAQLGVQSQDDQGAEKLGFPSSATRNTVRVGGADAVADAAGVASALFPATGSADRPTAVVLVDSKDWQSAIAAAVLAGPPIGAPLLLSERRRAAGGERGHPRAPGAKGSDLSKDAQVVRIGADVARPEGLPDPGRAGRRSVRRAAADRPLRLGRARRPSADVVLYSADRPQWRCPPPRRPRARDAALP